MSKGCYIHLQDLGKVEERVAGKLTEPVDKHQKLADKLGMSRREAKKALLFCSRYSRSFGARFNVQGTQTGRCTTRKMLAGDLIAHRKEWNEYRALLTAVERNGSIRVGEVEFPAEFVAPCVMAMLAKIQGRLNTTEE